MAEDAVIRFEVKLTASSSSEIKNLIQEAKEAKQEVQTDRENLATQKRQQGNVREVQRDYGKISKTVKRDAKNTEKAAGKAAQAAADEDDMIAGLLDQFSKEDTDEAVAAALVVPTGGIGAKDVAGIIGDIDSKGLGNLKAFAVNPTMMVHNQLMRVLSMSGPQGMVASAIITAILASPELVKALVEMFAVKGGPLNLDFRYSQEEQYGQEFDRVMQFKRITGDSPIITVDTHGYVAGDADFAGNSLVDSEITRTARISIAQKSLSFTTGI